MAGQSTNKETTYRIEVCVNQDWYKVNVKNIQTIHLARQKIKSLRIKNTSYRYRLIRIATYVYEQVVE